MLGEIFGRPYRLDLTPVADSHALHTRSGVTYFVDAALHPLARYTTTFGGRTRGAVGATDKQACCGGLTYHQVFGKTGSWR